MKGGRAAGRRAAAVRVALATLFALLGGACAEVRASEGADPERESAPFSHDDFDRVLERFVDERGLVDYPALAREPGDLERYVAQLARTSPDSDPALFPTREDRLAYWINAYNASVLATVLRHYPIPSVTAVRAPFPLSLASDKIGFFVLERIELGGDRTNLYALENSLIRRRFAEPRVHFALNCASLGCPRLPRRAFRGADLDQRLDEETRRFFAEERSLQVDHAARVVRLSSILDWYERDFTRWYEKRFPGSDATLLDYVLLYVAPERRAELEGARDYEVEFLPYDWRLNDRAAVR